MTQRGQFRMAFDTATTASTSGIIDCIIFGCAGRVAKGSWIACHHAVGVHHTLRSVAVDTRRVPLGDLMVLVRCFA